MNITRIIDCTILYPNIDDPVNVLDIMKGDKKAEVYMYYKNYYIINRDRFDEEWLRNIWLSKEELMKSFYENKQEFLDRNPTFNVIRLSWTKIVLINIFFTILCTCYILFFRYCLLDIYL